MTDPIRKTPSLGSGLFLSAAMLYENLTFPVRGYDSFHRVHPL